MECLESFLDVETPDDELDNIAMLAGGRSMLGLQLPITPALVD